MDSLLIEILGWLLKLSLCSLIVTIPNELIVWDKTIFSVVSCSKSMCIFICSHPIWENIRWNSPEHRLSIVKLPLPLVIVPLYVSWTKIFTNDKGSCVPSSITLPLIVILQFWACELMIDNRHAKRNTTRGNQHDNQHNEKKKSNRTRWNPNGNFYRTKQRKLNNIIRNY